MSNEWIYPWPKPISIHDSDGPRDKPFSYEPLDFELFGAKLRITPTRQTGVDSGRTRYKVECLTCGETIHPATTGASSLFNGHLEEKHGKARRSFAAAEVSPPVVASDKPERKRRDLCVGDNWRLELECKKPGESYMVLYIGGKQQGRIPIENVLQIHARFDEGSADAAQRLIETLRQQAGDWESKYYDKVVDQMRLAKLEGEVETAKRKQADAEAELARVRQAMGTRTDPELKGRFEVVLKVAQALIRGCSRCQGTGVMGTFPCPGCGTAREILAAQAPSSSESRGGLEARAEDWNSIFARQDEWARSAMVFMLHPGVGCDPYWEVANERDPEVIRLRAGHTSVGVKKEAYGPLPVAFMRGRFMALEPAVGGGEVWTEATEFVEVDRERGLAACPEYLRERYRALAEGRW